MWCFPTSSYAKYGRNCLHYQPQNIPLTQNKPKMKPNVNSNFHPKTPPASLKPALFDKIIWHLQSNRQLPKQDTTQHKPQTQLTNQQQTKPQKPLSCRKIKRGQQTLPQSSVLQKNAIRKVNLQKNSKVVSCSSIPQKSGVCARSNLEIAVLCFEWRFSEVLIWGSDILHALPLVDRRKAVNQAYFWF